MHGQVAPRGDDGDVAVNHSHPGTAAEEARDDLTDRLGRSLTIVASSWPGDDADHPTDKERDIT
jgi:hypothetical protein